MVITIPFLIGLIWLIFNIQFLKKLRVKQYNNSKISVLVPLRNEETHVHELMMSLKNLTYANAEFILYDDDSTDYTAQLIEERLREDARFRMIRGKTLPEGWRGKPHACQVLADEASGDVLLWIDADVTLQKKTLEAVATMFTQPIDALTGFPRFKASNVLERLLTPLLHFFVYFHLPIALANHQRMVAATAASGAFIAIRKEVYEEIGGHASVKDAVVEDVALFRILKRHDKKAMLYNITDFVSCAMYANRQETWQGFQKNCFRGINHSYPTGIFLVVFYLLYFFSPVGMAIYGLLMTKYVFLVPLACITLMRLISDVLAKKLNIYTLLMPVSAIVYCVLLVTTMIRTARQKNTYWKGRIL